MADAAVTVDLEMSYQLLDGLTLAVGANNLFDQEAQKLKEGPWVNSVAFIMKVGHSITTAVSTMVEWITVFNE